MFGPLKGSRFVVSELTGWASIVNRWEPGALSVYAKYVKPGDVAYDLGANTGMHAMALSKLVGSQGKVVAFEPVKANIAEIESVMALNDLKNVEIAPVAISDQNGTAEFLVGVHEKQGSLVGIGRETGETFTVTTQTLDSFVEGGGRPPNFIKIDIEGAEGMALKGFSNRVRDSLPIFSIDLHTPEQDLLIGAFFKGLGYSLYRFDANRSGADATMVKVKNLDAGWPDPDGVHGNVLALPPGMTP
jgi:FkbM family methyltransferase